MLHEISAPTGAEMERDTGHVNAYPGPYFFGRMTYVHGGGIDQPLMAIRHEYSDSLPNDVRIFPQTNYRGQYDSGVYGFERCVTVTEQGTQLAEPHAPLDFPDRETSEGPPDQGTGPTQREHCVGVDWSGKSMHASMERRSTWYYSPTWTGSLLQHSRDRRASTTAATASTTAPAAGSRRRTRLGSRVG